ncbi:MAG: nucleoside hydrolase [Spirosomataceae bacterium]
MKNLLYLSITAIIFSCTSTPTETTKSEPEKMRVIFDTDANNELDDQQALAYLFFNQETFDIEGITVNATINGGDIEGHYDEAKRIIKLCQVDGKIPLIRGANANFEAIQDSVTNATFDGSEAVDFIIDKSQNLDNKLVVIAVGKLTTIALALKKNPSLTERMKVVWLGSNYPEPGEYNQDNDTTSMNYVLKTNVPFEMVTVRYGKPSGTDAVRVTKTEAAETMPGLGPTITTPITGRHGGEFTNFGDYSADLFKHIDYHGDPPARAMFDMVAVAILKNPNWAEKKEIPCPVLIDNQWIERPENPRKIMLWENFDAKNVMKDFYVSLKNTTNNQSK